MWYYLINLLQRNFATKKSNCKNVREIDIYYSINNLLAFNFSTVILKAVLCEYVSSIYMLNQSVSKYYIPFQEEYVSNKLAEVKNIGMTVIDIKMV